MTKSTIKLVTKNNHERALAELQNIYQNKIIPAEKKPYIIDHEKSIGPYMATIGDETRFIQDAASQIATLALGFNPSAFFGVAQFEESWTNNLYSKNAKDIFKAFKGLIRDKLGNKKAELTYTNSGAEANEVALGFIYKNRKNKNAKKVIAFEGSFHGRFLISLFSTWNKSKREPFEIPGYETTFIPFPELKSSDFNVIIEKEWLELWENATDIDLKSKLDRYIKNYKLEDKALLENEINSLLKTREQLSTGEHFAVIIEPMQCEGGDRYATNRFFSALLLLNKSFQVETVIDEVQTGFHLGRDFFWHKSFNMKDSHGHEIKPEFITCAKKAQTGIAISTEKVFKKNEEIQFASVLRGFYHALAINQSTQRILDIEQYTKKKLDEYLAKWNVAKNPRVFGLAFAYDLEDEQSILKFVNLRFNTGLLFYQAGTHTLRFRLNTSYKNSDIDYLFHALDLLSEHIFNNKDLPHDLTVETNQKDVKNNYLWTKKLISAKKMSKAESTTDNTKKDISHFISHFFEETYGLSFIEITKNNFSLYKEQIENIQKSVYEPARQTEIEKFEKIVNTSPNIAIGLLKDGKLVGISFAGIINFFPFESGLRLTTNFENKNALYMLDTTTTEDIQGMGVGKYLKYSVELLAIAKGLEYIYGRNRHVLASAMLNINMSLGLVPELFIRENYLDDEKHRDVLIYRSPLHWHDDFQFQNTISSPLLNVEVCEEFINRNIGELINKICLSNFISKNFIEDIEYLAGLVPQELKHIYTASGQSECVDKVYKAITYKARDKKRQRVLTFRGHYFGEGSFLSRSLSSEIDPYFPVEYFDHPTKDNWKDLITQINQYLTSNSYIAFFMELEPQNKNLSSMPEEFLKELKVICDKHDVRIVFNLSSSFAFKDASALPITPNAIFSYLGGQAGACFMDQKNYVEDPLMLISTWDGDALSTAQFVYAHKLNQVEKKNDASKLTNKLISKFNLTEISSFRFIKVGPRSYAKERKISKKEVLTMGPINLKRI